MPGGRVPRPGSAQVAARTASGRSPHGSDDQASRVEVELALEALDAGPRRRGLAPGEHLQPGDVGVVGTVGRQPGAAPLTVA